MLIRHITFIQILMNAKAILATKTPNVRILREVSNANAIEVSEGTDSNAKVGAKICSALKHVLLFNYKKKPQNAIMLVTENLYVLVL